MSKLPPMMTIPNARASRRMLSRDSSLQLPGYDDETATSAGTMVPSGPAVPHMTMAPNAHIFRHMASQDSPPQLPPLMVSPVSTGDDEEQAASAGMTAPSVRTMSHISAAVLRSPFCSLISGGGFDVVVPKHIPPPLPRLNALDSARAARFRRCQIAIIPSDRVAQVPREFRREDEGQPCRENIIDHGLVALSSSSRSGIRDSASSPVPPLPSSQDKDAPTSYSNKHYLRHTPDRAAMRRNISRIVVRRVLPPDVARRMDRTPFSVRWAAAVESCLYKGSASMEDYADEATLERRVEIVSAAVARRTLATRNRQALA